VYSVIKPSLLEAIQEYLAETDPLDDAPSHAYMKRIIIELEDQPHEASIVFKSMNIDSDTITIHKHGYLPLFVACGGVHGPDRDNEFIFPEKRYELPLEGGRDGSWEPAVMQVPPREPQNVLEQRLWIAIDHANEVWASESDAALIWEYEDMSWQLYYNAARWTYDEMRHAMMCEQRLAELGFELGKDVPMVPDHWRVFRPRGVLTLLLLVHGLEQKGPLHIVEQFMFREDLHEWIEQLVFRLADLLHSAKRREDNPQRLIERVKRYVEQNYCKPITLGQVSEWAQVTESHLSKQFVKETGEHFIEYVFVLTRRPG